MALATTNTALLYMRLLFYCRTKTLFSEFCCSNSLTMDKVAFRRRLRRDATAAEVMLWQELRNRQVQGRKFRRQHSLGSFTVDFFCVEEHLVIELDGQSHSNIGAMQADEQRDKWLNQEGYKVLRFSNDEVYQQVERVVWKIEDAFGWYR